MTARELREKYLEFFKTKGHLVVSSAPLVPIDVTGREDASLLFTGAGMVQFKPYFRGLAEPPSKRLTDVQRCLRTTDIDEVGDATHLTFFEMLGNFSFGDYFKEEAIAFSWEFLTSQEWLGLDPMRLSFTVHESDEASFAAWSKFVRSVGLEPEERIFRMGEETNFWPAGAYSNGPPGPCGPNTEMFYWVSDDPPPHGSRAKAESGGEQRGKPYGRDDWLRDEKAGKWLEIWNDVFIQYEWKGRLRDASRPDKGWEKEGMDPLPFPSVDTGMGLERTITALTGKESVYDNDLFEPVFRALSRCACGRAEPSESSLAARRIIADHVRAASFCIADGILPSNTGRGYVLRRLIRRAVLKGQRTLEIEEPFLFKVFDGVAEALGDVYPELTEKRETIVETLRIEEELFRRTLKEGMEQFQRLLWDLALTRVDASNWTPEEVLQYVKRFPDPSAFRNAFGKQGLIAPGARVFQLYDTFGFPLEVTRELCEEAGITLDVEGYYKALEEQQERSRASHAGETVYGGVSVTLDLYDLHNLPKDPNAAAKPTPTVFTGYRETTTEARIVGALPAEGEEGLVVLALDRSPFYVESGGEVSDTGWIRGQGFEFEVVDLIKQDGVIVHLAKPLEGDFDLVGKPFSEARGYLQARLFNQPVRAEVDAPRRRRITRNHTATHLLHAALRQVLGKHVTQAGSLVAPDHLRFDFTHGKALTESELEAVERIVNERALEGIPIVVHENVPIAEAKARGAMALFGEKYGDTVRMVEAPGFSLELCGGCHVANTAEIGLFKIVRESSAASGVRRIEALTGEGAYDWVREHSAILARAAALLKTSPPGLTAAIEKLQEQLREERRRLERLRSQATAESQATVSQVGTVELAIDRMEGGEAKDATLRADQLAEGHPNRVALVALIEGGDERRVVLVAKVGKDAQAKGAHAGNLVREIAKMVGGGGGGRSDFATAGGRDPLKLDEALRTAPRILEAQIKS